MNAALEEFAAIVDKIESDLTGRYTAAEHVTPHVYAAVALLPAATRDAIFYAGVARLVHDAMKRERSTADGLEAAVTGLSAAAAASARHCTGRVPAGPPAPTHSRRHVITESWRRHLESSYCVDLSTKERKKLGECTQADCTALAAMRAAQAADATRWAGVFTNLGALLVKHHAGTVADLPAQLLAAVVWDDAA